MRRSIKAQPKERFLKPEPPQEEVNYPCHWPLSGENARQMAAMKLYPEDPRLYTRRIPFKGAKEFFLKRTGRNRFDVYEYRFTARSSLGEVKDWWIMWDYYNGLVRVHDFFDCCKPGKTEPGNAVKEKVNPGLADICHNITGGNLHAQGYWIPYDAARALASKFCYDIRHALTIVFGPDFPATCLAPSHPDFGKFEIPTEIIQSCRILAGRQYRAEKKRLLQGAASSSSSPASSRPQTPAPTTTNTTTNTTTSMRFFDPVRNDFFGPRGHDRERSASPPRYTSPAPRHGLETFTPEKGAARDRILVIEPLERFTAHRMRDEFGRQVVEDPERNRELEAAGALVSLGLRDHELRWRGRD